MAIVGRPIVTIQLADGGWALHPIDLVLHEGGYWLVPHWSVSPDGRTRSPVRIVSLTTAETGAPTADPGAFAGYPIPETIMSDGHVPLSLARLFVVREAPELSLPVDGGGS